MLATHRLQDGFAMANYHFDPETKRVVHNDGREGAARTSPEGGTRFLVLREGQIYFEGTPEKIASSQDTYLKRFLV
jgi:hypothetical protein